MADEGGKSPIGDGSWDDLLSHAFREARLRGAEGEQAATAELPTAPRYQIGDELSRDAASVLLRARDREVDRDVALRVLGADGDGDETSVRRFLEEAQVGAQLQHPGILPVYGLGLLEDGRAYVASRILEGETLAQLLTGGTSPERLLSILEQAAHAAAYAHARGVAHGALDASRIHVGPHGEVVISGWERAVRASWDAHRVEADVSSLVGLLGRVLGRSINGRLTSAAAVARAIGRHLAGREARTRQAEVEAATARVEAERERARALRNERLAQKARSARQRTLALAAGLLLVLSLGFGGYAWRRGEEAAEHARVEAQLAATLREAKRQAAAGNWAEARAFASKAVALAPGAGGGREQEAEGLLQRIEETARVAEEDEALLSRLEKIRLAFFRGDLLADVSDAIRRAFLDVGLDPLSMSPEALASSLRARTRPLDFAAELDFWAVFATEEFKEPLLTAAGSVDPHPWRRRLRRIYLEQDFAGARELAATADLPVLPRPALYLLAHVLGDCDLPRAAAICREALLRRPDDILWRETLRWNVCVLAQGEDHHWTETVKIARGPLAWSVPETREWSRCVASALASLPDDAATWANLGYRLATLGESRRARAALNRSMELKPASFRALHELTHGLKEIGDADGAHTWAREAVARRPELPAAHYLLGVVLCDHVGDFEGAVREFRETLRLGWTDSGVFHGLARALFELGDADAARDASRQAYRAVPESRPGEKLAALGRLLCLEGSWQQAAETLRSALRYRPEDDSIHFDLAYCLDSLGRPTEALGHARRAVALAPRDTKARHLVGSILCDGIGDYAAAAREFREALELRPKQPFLHESLGNALVHLGRLEEAAEAYQTASDLTPTARQSEKLRSLGLAQGARGEHQRALETFRQALRHGPDDSCTLMLVGHQLCTLSRWQEAVPVLERALQKSRRPRPLKVLHLLSVALSCLDRYEEALAVADRAVELAPSSAESHLDRAYALSMLGRATQAIDSYRRGIELGPEPAGVAALAHSNLGAALNVAGRPAEAIPHLRRALELDPSLPNSYFNLGSALDATGNHEGSIRAWRAGLRLRPDDLTALNTLAWQLATTPHAELREAEEAVAFARRAVRAAPASDRGKILNTLGVALYRAKRYEDAIGTLEEAHRLRPETGAYDGLFLAMAHFRLGRTDQAREWLRKSVRWMEASGGGGEEILRFRAEAEALIGDGGTESEK